MIPLLKTLFRAHPDTHSLSFALLAFAALVLFQPPANAATFTDANWVSMNPSVPGTDDTVYATVVDGSGNLYVGGQFTVAGDVFASKVAKWNGTNWSPLGSGMNGSVLTLVLRGNELFAGGEFLSAGGQSANYIAKWDGTNWTPLGSGLSGTVRALAVCRGLLRFAPA